jgi:dsRNA-specific ribonuclease
MLPISELRGQNVQVKAVEILKELQEDVLLYQFKKPKLLLHALTHRSAKDHYGLEDDYEKLEILGDAILDYVISINMMRLTIFESYLPKTGD